MYQEQSNKHKKYQKLLAISALFASGAYFIFSTQDQSQEELAEVNLVDQSRVCTYGNNNPIPDSVCHWWSVKKYARAPDDIFPCGYTKSDGPQPLYCGRVGPGQEVGKYNMSGDGSQMWHLWTHDGGKYTDRGQVLGSNMDHLLQWVPYTKGDRLPRTAILGGLLSDDGSLFIGRQSGGGNVGKINTESRGSTNTNINNLWTHGDGRESGGDILCTRPLVESVTFSTSNIASCAGKGKSTFKMSHEWSTASSTYNEDWSYKNQVKGSIDAAWGSGFFTLNWQNDFSEEFHKVISDRSQSDKESREFELDCSEDTVFWWYQPVVTTKMYDGDVLTFKGAPTLTNEKPPTTVTHKMDY